MNDVQMWKRALVDQFGFSPSDIRVLVDGLEDRNRSPTCKNIRASIQTIISESSSDDQIVIVLSGHGSRIPVARSLNLQAPHLAGADGFDEVFLPTDVKSWTPEGLENAISGHEIEGWLDRFQRAGTHVWIIFDCCQAAGLASPPDAMDEHAELRGVGFAQLGIPQQVIELARVAAKTAAKSKAAGRLIAAKKQIGWIQLPVPNGRLPASGTVVAFYACQSNELEPALPRPVGAAHVKENYFSLFTYNILATLSRQKEPVTYEQLMREIKQIYDSERPGRPPRVSMDGSTDRQVLGLTKWPKPPEIWLSLEKGGELTINAGELMGLRHRSVLSVRKSGAYGQKQRVLGYIRIKKLLAATSVVEPTSFNGNEALRSDLFPAGAHCEVVSRNEK